MPNPSSREFLEILFGDPMPSGKLVIYTITLKNGVERTHWFYHLPQADRLCRGFRNTRQVCFSPALQSQEKALAVAQERRTRAKPGNITGCEAAITALTALWAIIPFGKPGTPPDLPRALGLLEAVDHRPSIVITTSSSVAPKGRQRNTAPKGRQRNTAPQGRQQNTAPQRPPNTGVHGDVYAIWRLRRPWVFALDDSAAAERNAARVLLGRVQGAVARLAAEEGWRLGVAVDGAAGSLAAAFPLPGFPAGARPGGPRAVLEVFPLLPDDGRYRRRDFESLPDPPEADSQPWRDVLEPDADPPPELHDFLPIADGCSWIRACRAERATLPAGQVGKAIKVLARCQAPGADGSRLAHLVAEGHPGYDPVEVERLLARVRRDPGGAVTCTEIGKSPGVVERHCSKCPHFGLIQAPVELAALPSLRGRGASEVGLGQDLEPQARDSGALAALPSLRGRGASADGLGQDLEPQATEAARDPAADTAPAPGAPPPGSAGAIVTRPRIVITCRRHEVNDQAMTALAAGADLFERRGTVVELVRYAGAAPATRRVTGPRLEELLSRHCEFVERAGDGTEPREAAPPRWTTRSLLARGRWPELPQLAETSAGPTQTPTRVGAAQRGGPGTASNDDVGIAAGVTGRPRRATPSGTPPPGTAAAADLLKALEPVLATLGGEATARRITGALAAEPERFPDLAAAFERFAPGLEPGDPESAAVLGYRLRPLKGRPRAGRVLVEKRRTCDGIVWAVERPGPATGDPTPSAQTASPSTDPQPKEESHAMNPRAQFDSYGPSPAALKHLERIGRHRDAFAGVDESRHQTVVRERLERHFDFMEEIVCEEPFDAEALAEAWQEVDQLEVLYRQGTEEPAAAAPAANDTLPTRKVA